MMRKCSRCGSEFVVVEAAQRHCFQCAREVAAIITADEKRRNRFPRAVDLTGRLAA